MLETGIILEKSYLKEEVLYWLHSSQRITSQQYHEETQAILLAPTQVIGVEWVRV